MSGAELGRLVTLVRRKDRPVCVMLPGAGGGLNPYMRLASHLGKSFSVYVVRAAGLLPRDTVEDTVDAMADSAVEALDGREPALVFGWSLGGTIAWEMCARLADRGVQPDLVIVDSSPMPRVPSPESDGRIRDAILRGLGPRPDEGTLQRVEQTFQAQVRALAAYSAQRSYPGRVQLLMCPDNDTDDVLTDRPGDVQRWRSLAPDLRLGKLDASHYEVFDPAHLAQLTGEIDAFLSQAGATR
jgi:thioesterase domain-containing protein